MDNQQLLEFVTSIPNKTIAEAFLKANEILANHDNVVVSISGGGDSDLVLDIIEKLKGDKQITYVWFNTGLEYQATKDHLKYLEQKYGIEILREPPTHSIPYCCKEYGVPFLNKNANQYIEILQRHNFKWEDKSYEELCLEYPKIKSAISWWCNHRDVTNYGYSIFNINYNKWLKEFLIANPPTFKISNKCCKYAKKDPSAKFLKRVNADLSVLGIRKSEGGIRATLLKSCFDDKEDKINVFRPIFWLSDNDKKEYENYFDITHSACYSVFGFKRTGCVGCPYNRNVLTELEVIKQYEPKLYKACMNIFGESYEYTKKYREFYAEQEEKLKCNSQNAII